MSKKRPLRISSVSYSNSWPFVYGIRHAGELGEFRLSLDIPSVCARKVLSGQADIGLAPVAVLLAGKDLRVLPGFCIGANGSVRSVLLHSDVPLNQIRTILLDYQSRTSVLLVRILCRYYWKIDPALVPARKGYEKKIGGDVAGLIIGDRNFMQGRRSRYRVDLSGEWKKYTGLPFVFACWISRRPLSHSRRNRFLKALTFGVQNRKEAVKEMGKQAKRKIPPGYLERDIRYELGPGQRKALRKFLLLGRKIEAAGQKRQY